MSATQTPNRRGLVVFALLLVFTPAHAYAQTQSPKHDGTSVTPNVGMYIPMGSLIVDPTVRLRPVAAVAVGARVAHALSSRWSLEGAATWSPNLVAQSDWKATVDLEGGVVFGSARGRLYLNRMVPRGEVAVTLVSGVGLVHRYGDAWTGMTGTTDAALVLGGGLRYSEAASGFSFTMDVENFMTRTGYNDSSGRQYVGQLQSDVLISFGISIDVWR
jgi:hypothetical protein